MSVGWQGKPLPPKKPQCAHLGAGFAATSAHRYAEGTEWICQCGQKFWVVSNGGKNKKLVKKGR